MSFPINLWPAWFLPDEQPHDWYQWLLVAAGHASLGMGAFVVLSIPVGRVAAWVICLAVYVAIETLHLALGGTLSDGLTDALVVIGGMMTADEAMKREPYGFAAMVCVMALASAIGVGLRL